MGQIAGYILIILGVADFLLGNFANMNFTYFLGPLSSFSPLILGGLGVLILNGSKPKDNQDTD